MPEANGLEANGIRLRPEAFASGVRLKLGGEANEWKEKQTDELAEAIQRERALLRPRGRVPLTNKQTNKPALAES